MSVYHTDMSLRRRIARFATILMALAAAATAGRAQTPPYAEFQYSTLTASGNTITATQVPVVTSTGTSYYNVVVEFDVAANGTLTIAPGYPQIVPSPIQLISNFLAGTYTNSSGYSITVAGPGVTSAGATEWSLSAPESGCAATPENATWYVFGGPMTKNPLYPRLKAAGITSEMYGFYSWGTTGTQTCDAGADWAQNTLIGVSQVGDALAIVSFTANGIDQNQPADTVPYVGSMLCTF